MFPEAPVRFSTTTCLPRFCDMPAATWRATTSTAEPAANGLVSLTGRDGHSCAARGGAIASAAKRRATRSMGARSGTEVEHHAGEVAGPLGREVDDRVRDLFRLDHAAERAVLQDIVDARLVAVLALGDRFQK